MTRLLERESSGASGPGFTPHTATGPARAARRKLLPPILLQLGAMIGIAALVYANAADWFATLNHNAVISGYVQAVDQLPDAVKLHELEVARAYNSQVPAGLLRDPYSATADTEAETAAYAAYEQILRVSDHGVLGEIQYPRLGIGLPVYHGTSDAVISRGAGHLYGSSLPVGGPSTHAVLTAHSGLVSAALFTPLLGARVDDTFQIRVLGETRYYRVDSIETVLPDQTESLRIVPGADYVTLITCAPIGINSHRMLVRGVRIPAPESEGTRAIDGDGRVAGFPWWAVIFLGGSAVSASLLFISPRRRVAASRAQKTTSGSSSYPREELGGEHV